MPVWAHASGIRAESSREMEKGGGACKWCHDIDDCSYKSWWIMNILHTKCLAGSVLRHNHRIWCQYNIRRCWLIHYVTQDYLSVIMLLLWYICSHERCQYLKSKQSRLPSHSIFSHRVKLTDPWMWSFHFQAAKLHTLTPSLWLKQFKVPDGGIYIFNCTHISRAHTGAIVRKHARGSGLHCLNNSAAMT